MYYFKMIFIFLKEQLRAPFSVIWTVSSPVILFFFLHFDDVGKHSGDGDWLKGQVSWFIGYISFSVIMFSYCLYLNGRRESGFIATFVHDPYSKCLFIISQLIASIIMSVIYVVFFLLIVYLGFGVYPNLDIPILALQAIAISLVLTFSFTWLASLPVTFQTANTIFSVMITVFMVFGIVSFRMNDGIIFAVNLINPILIYSNVIHCGTVYYQAPGFTYTLVFYCAMIIISFMSIIKFRTEPVWSSQ
ncbi:protein mcbE (plasmid) [Rahnella aquatilis]|nr:protein mcbE [Rahnella aquatilis]